MRSVILLFFVLISCEIFAQDFKIGSNPEGAEIFVSKNGNDGFVRVGATPLVLPLGELQGKYSLGNIFTVTLKKEGFDDYTILMAPINGSTIDISVNMKVEKDLALYKTFDSITSGLFEGQRLIRNKSYDAAIDVFTDLEKKNPHLSTIYEMKAGAFYLKKDFTNALSYYRKAFSVNSENKDAYSMKLYLEKALGVSDAK